MQQQKTVYINFFDGVDLTKVNKFIQFTSEVVTVYNPTELYFFIASSGGDVDSGFVLHNYLISLQGKLAVTMHNTGMIDSIANVIFLAGQRRLAAPNASFLFHGVSMNFSVPQSRVTLQEALSRLVIMENRIASTISSNTALKVSEIEILFRQGEGKDIDFALEKGIIHEVVNPSIPQGAVHLAMSFV